MHDPTSSRPAPAATALPAASAHTAPESESTPEPGTWKPAPPVASFLPPIRAPRVLVVDDDPELRAFVARAVSRTDDIELEWADGVSSARELLATRRYVAVLADYLLADSETGTALWRETRKYQPDAIFAMMSSHAVNAGRELPFLPKPFTLAECRRFVMQLVEDREERDQAREQTEEARPAESDPQR